MACFVVPAAEAVVTTVATQVMKKKEAAGGEAKASESIPVSRKLGWLSKLLWGGSALLCFEHVWHGEIVPWFPFLTAAEDPAELAEVFHEMATVGSSMAVLLTAVWVGMLVAVKHIQKKGVAAPKAAK